MRFPLDTLARKGPLANCTYVIHVNTEKNHAACTPTHSRGRMMWKRTTRRKRQMTRFGMIFARALFFAYVVASDVAHALASLKNIMCRAKWHYITFWQNGIISHLYHNINHWKISYSRTFWYHVLITDFQCHMAWSLSRFHPKFPTGCFRQLWRKQYRKWGRLHVLAAGHQANLMVFKLLVGFHHPLSSVCWKFLSKCQAGYCKQNRGGSWRHFFGNLACPIFANLQCMLSKVCVW